jgi:SAM-dependent methyltransferase
VDTVNPEAIELISAPGSVYFPDEWYQLTEPTHFWFQWRLAAALRQLRSVGVPTGEPLRALEVGSGTGVLRDQLEACTRWTIDITDLQLAALRRARRGRGRILYYDILEERSPFLGAYDVVILFDIIEHIKATRPFVASVLRHVKPGGHVLLNVPALEWLFGAYDVAAGHMRRYDKRTLAAEFAGTDTEVLAASYWGISLLPLLAARKLILRARSPSDAIIRAGFRPPGRLAHAVLRSIMGLELALCPAPPLGTSLLVAVRKRGG